MSWFTRMILSTIAVIVCSYLLSGVHINGVITALVVAIVLSFLNTVLKPLFIVLTIPFTLLTFGLFLFVINACIILIADFAVPGFDVDGFWWALIFSFLLSIVNGFLGTNKKSDAEY